MLSPKENALRMIYHENPEYIPMTFEAFSVIGMPLSGALDAPLQSGYDPFGIYWHVDSLGGIPDNSKFLFEDIADWEKYVKIPDVSDIDFKGWAEKELAGINRDEKLVTYYHSTGIWERAASFMGFENTMINMVEDPDSFDSLLSALTEYRITVAESISAHLTPGVYAFCFQRPSECGHNVDNEESRCSLRKSFFCTDLAFKAIGMYNNHC